MTNLQRQHERLAVVVGKPVLDGKQVKKQTRPSQHGFQGSFMKIHQPIAGLCLAALLSACGGGDAAPAATPVAAATFPLDAAYTKAMTTGVSLSGTAVDGADTYTMSLSITPASDAIFEGLIRKKSLEVLTLKKNGAVLTASSINAYYTINPFRTQGASYSDGTYAVQPSTTGTFPATAKVGDSGVLGTLFLYANASKTIYLGTTYSTWTLEADTATTAFSCVNSVIKDAAGVQTGTAAGCYKIDTNGNALGMRYTLSVAGKTLIFR